MQFAGVRTDLELNELEEPHNYLIRMTDDVLPEPDAVLITGITPQKTLVDGISEADFLKLFHEHVVTPGTIFVGFNTVRFDDEFMRYMHYRNYYDPYEWQYTDDKSRWDLLDLVRMTRALRPTGMRWPVNAKGKATNRLEMLTSINELDHANAHDALNDVRATVAVARMLRDKQPKLFDYLLKMRKKENVAELVNAGKPFVYSSGKYPEEFEKTAVVAMLAEHPRRQAALVYDLRHDPKPFLKMSASELADAWRWMKEPTSPRLPIKTLQFNRCPAIAPLTVLDDDSRERLEIDLDKSAKHLKLLHENADFKTKVLEALDALDAKQQIRFLEDESEVDTQLYDGFFAREDKTKMSMVRASSPDELTDIQDTFKDSRLQSLMPLYKARNFPKALTDAERKTWDLFRERKLLGGKEASRMAKYFERLGQLSERPDISAQDMYLLEELQLYGQSIMPEVS